MEEVTDEPLCRDRVCGIDIGKAGMVATIRVPSDANPVWRASETRSFGTTRREVLALADWLRSWQVPAVVMESTGDYWKGPFYRLEAEGFECVLADAKQVKNLPRSSADAHGHPWTLPAGQPTDSTCLPTYELGFGTKRPRTAELSRSWTNSASATPLARRIGACEDDGEGPGRTIPGLRRADRSPITGW